MVEREATSRGTLETVLQAQKHRVVAALTEEQTVAASPILHHDETLRSTEYLTVVYELHHVHLPELRDAGVVRFDRHEDVVTRGPRFTSRGPVVESGDGL